MHDDRQILLVTEDARGVVTLTLNRPQAYNALSEAMLRALGEQLEDVERDTDVRAVVIRSEGKAFCAGHDLREMRSKPSLDYYRSLFTQCSEVMLAIARVPVPVIARVHGIATAAGCQLVAACDLGVASAEARFAVSGVNLGLFCTAPSVPLSRNVGRKAAFEMAVTGEFIDAERARELGLVNRVVPPEQLDAAVEALLAAILSKPAVAIAHGKSLFYRQIELNLEDAYKAAAETMACNMMEEDTLEGVQAFLEKRPPAWSR